jgi:hypothetical protein
MVESAPVAEYQEWPFQGFLKRTKIGDKTIYNLEFQLLHVPEQLHLPILSKALGMRSGKKTSAEAAALHDAGVHSKMHPAAVRRPIKRVRWTPEEDATIFKMREEDGCSWEEIHAALPSRTLTPNPSVIRAPPAPQDQGEFRIWLCVFSSVPSRASKEELAQSCYFRMR